MKKTYTKNEIIEILLSLAEKTGKEAQEFEDGGDIRNRDYSGGKHQAYKTTACWLDKITIKG